MIPPHSTPVLQLDGSIVRPPCWCGPIAVFEVGVNDDGESYVFPHTYHDAYPLWMYHALAEGPGRIPPC